MFLNIDYAKRAAAREKNVESAVISHSDDDDIDYEQLFDDQHIPLEISKPKKPVKRVRFAPIVSEDSPTPTLSRPSSARPTFEVEFDFDSLESPSTELAQAMPPIAPRITDSIDWKNAFLTDLHIAKKNKTTVVSSPPTVPVESKTSEDTLWDFMRESNPQLLEKLERTQNDKQKRLDRFSMQQSVTTNRPTVKLAKAMPAPREEGIRQEDEGVEPSSKPTPAPEAELQQPEPSNISLIEIRLENDQFNQTHEELLRFLIPYHQILCQTKIWPAEQSFTSPHVSLQLIKNISETPSSMPFHFNRSDILKHLMFIYTITSFLYVFAYCSLQTAIRHVENVIVQNMKNVCIGSSDFTEAFRKCLERRLDQERGKPLFDLLTKTHQKYENILHPKILHMKIMFMDFFERRRSSISTMRQISEPKFLLLVQYESIDLLHDIERGLLSIIELHPYVYDRQNNVNREELNDLFLYNNMIIVRTRQISPAIIVRPKRLTLVIEYEYGEQALQWHRFCQQQVVSYVAYKTVLPSFVAPEKQEAVAAIEKKSSPMMKEEPLTLPTIVLARPLVDNFKLLRTLECRHDISIITRDYHLLGIPIDQQPDLLIDGTTSMLIFDLNTKLDINIVRHKIQSMTVHSCRIHVAILTSGSIPDFILSTYITPITQLAKQIQENESNIDIQIKSFSSLDDFANHVAQLVQQEHTMKYILTPTPSWNEKVLLRRCLSLNSISAQLILQRVNNIDLSTVTLDILISQCPEIPSVYLQTFLSDMHKST